MDLGKSYSNEEVKALEELRPYFPPDTSDDQMLEIYNNPELFKQFMDELQAHYTQIQESYSLYDECVLPVLQQGWESMWLLLLYCLLLRILSLAKLPKSMINLASFLFGCLSLWKFYGGLLVYVLLPVVIIFTISLVRKLPGLVLTLLVGIYMLACEFFLPSSVNWNKIKGSVMIVSMKMVSVAFDQENKLISDLSLVEYYGYIFNPASLMFGPFITYNDYQQLFMRHPLSLNWILNCLRAILISYSCLLWSSCGTTNYLTKLESYISVLEGNRWWRAYREAQQFRFSHYFISYISEATCLLMGIGTLASATQKTVASSKKEMKEKIQNEKKERKEETKEEVAWSLPIARILQVEFPRTLVDVVTNWNLPMHYWLKSYIFKSTRKYGVFSAILLTFIASSMLHGFNFQLSAVLLSIGTFSYVESVFRHSLAKRLNACIEARSCRDCTHKYTKWNFWVVATNLLFSFITLWNLAYLGCLFDSSNEEEQGYSMSHAVQRWKDYQFANHVFMFTLLVLQKFLSMTYSPRTHEKKTK